MGAKMFDRNLGNRVGVKTKGKYVNERVGVIEGESERRDNFRRILRVMDEQDAVNRYKWFNIPAKLSSQEIERLLYYKGQIAFFYFKDLNEFFFMPYALSGSIDYYGRYNTIHPVPYASGTDGENDRSKAQSAVLSQLNLNCKYDIVLEDELKEEDLYKSAVLLWDYTKQKSETLIPRQILNEELLLEMGDILSYFDTSLLIGSGVEGYRVDNADSKDEVERLASGIYNAAINRTPYIALTGNVDFQELTTGAKKNTVADFLMAFQGIDNFRLSTYGIANGGVYEKQAHILESEMQINNSSVYSPLQDGLKLRQRFCNIVNSIWGTSLWCEPSEAALKLDLDGDGVDYDREDTPEEEQEMQEGGLENGEK